MGGEEMKTMPKEVWEWRANLSRAERRRLLDEKAKYIFTNWRGQACIWCGARYWYSFVTQTYHKAGWFSRLLNWWEKRREEKTLQDGHWREQEDELARRRARREE
jgi:hypothetical protein